MSPLFNPTFTHTLLLYLIIYHVFFPLLSCTALFTILYLSFLLYICNSLSFSFPFPLPSFFSFSSIPSLSLPIFPSSASPSHHQLLLLSFIFHCYLTFPFSHFITQITIYLTLIFLVSFILIFLLFLFPILILFHKHQFGNAYFYLSLCTFHSPVIISCFCHPVIPSYLFSLSFLSALSIPYTHLLSPIIILFFLYLHPVIPHPHPIIFSFSLRSRVRKTLPIARFHLFIGPHTISCFPIGPFTSYVTPTPANREASL